jgi:uncharacterized protein (DUF433 family)
MTFVIHDDRVPLRVTDNDVVRIGKTRVLLELVIHSFSQGATPEEIVFQYSSLDLADVYYVLGYYLRHREEVDAYVHQQAEQVDEIIQQMKAQSDRPNLREELLARRTKRAS